MEPVCGNCAYHHLRQFCRRYPPIPMIHKEEFRVVMPLTEVTHWCGEWQDMATEPPEAPKGRRWLTP